MGDSPDEPLEPADGDDEITREANDASPGEDIEPVDDMALEDLRQRVRERVAELERAGEQPLDKMDTEERQVRIDDLKQDTELRRKYAYWMFGLMAAQLAVTSTLIFLVAALGYDWELPQWALNLYIGGTFGELVGLAYVITRYLFPSKPGSGED